MNAQAQRREAPSPYPAAANAAEARKLAENLMEVMSGLLSVIERETELVRAGKLREAMALEPQKTVQSRRYVAVVGRFVVLSGLLSTPYRIQWSGLNAITTWTSGVNSSDFQDEPVSENIVRGVNAEMQRRNMPNTYTAAGRQTAPGPRQTTPLSVSRSL